MTAFLGVYKAIYAYQPQNPEELAIDEEDLLYLLQKSDVDDWWTVKKRVIGTDQEEPVGLVPNNYIEQAPVISHAKALYDYDQVQNPDEELLFHEGDEFDVYDNRDPDWILCSSKTSGEIGFVPGNYVEISEAAPVGSNSFPPPPQHASKQARATTDVSNINIETDDHQQAEEDELPPPKPTRPAQTSYEDDIPPPQPARPVIDSYDYGEEDEEEEVLPQSSDRLVDEASASASSSHFHTWNVFEVEGRKKRKAKLAINDSTIFFTPAKGTPQQWSIENLLSYNNEKKHVFLEFSNPYASLEIHSGTTDTATRIMTVLAELKGAYNANGLREVEAASKHVNRPSSSGSRKQGKIIYDFIGESADELSVKEGQLVYILNDKKSKDWWMCESVDTGKQGVVPAQFVEPINQLSTMMGNLKKFTKSPKKSSNNNSAYNISKDDVELGGWKDDAEQNVSASKKKSARERASSFLGHKKKGDKESKKDASKKSFPNPKKTRIWADRSGTFKVDAEFIGCVDGKIHLHKANGVKIAVNADKLSPDDVIYVERLTGMSLDKYKPKASTNKGGPASAKDKERERRRKLKEQEEREREREERERDRKLREQELQELRRARDLLDKERETLRSAQEKELPPIKPPRPTLASQGSSRSSPSSSKPQKQQAKQPDYDWFEFFLNCGVDVNNCQRYTINFEREQIAEEILPDIQPSLLRTLGLREGDIIRVMKFLDKKFGRDSQPQQDSATSANGGMFSEPDGSLKVNNSTSPAGGTVTGQLLAQNTAPTSSTTQDDEAWTVRPAAKSETSLPQPRSQFTGSMQDLLDLQPLEPKKTAATTTTTTTTSDTPIPAPNLKDLESVKTGASSKDGKMLDPTKTGASLVPLDPFKTGGHNILPMSTGGFVVMPMATGGLIPLQRTGGVVVPQTTFGIQPTGGILPVQKTSGGLIPASTTGGLLPQTTFGMQPTGGLMMPLQRTGGAISLPQTSFGNQMTGGANMMPQTSFGGQITGGANMMAQPSFGNQMTGGANMMPQTSFGNQMTGGANMMPQASFGNQMTGGFTQQATTGGPIMPLQRTGGAMSLTQTSFGAQATGGFQPQSQFGLTLQKTGGVTPLPQTSFSTGGPLQQPINNFNTNANGLTNMLQNTSISQQPLQPQQLQSQPTGFGFGNGPAQQPKQANLYNATADNPFGF